MADLEKTGLTGSTVFVPSRAETLTGALVGASFAYLAAVLATGGYEFYVLGLSVRSQRPSRPLFALMFFILLRWLVSARRRPLSAQLKSLVPWGIATVIAGSAIFAAAAGQRVMELPLWVQVVVAGCTAVGFLLAWMAWSAGPKTPLVVVALCFLAISAPIAASLSKTSHWAKTFGIVRMAFASGAFVAADREGLLSGEGSGVTFEKRPVGIDWRDCAVLSPGGFFSSKVRASRRATLHFSAARSGELSGTTARVSLLVNGNTRVVWETDATALAENTWLDVAVPLEAEGDGQLEFSLEGDRAGGSMLFANPVMYEEGAVAAGGPNVVLVVVDALRADRMSLYGHTRPTTPEIDQLASRGVVFEDCIAQAPWTMPSMASMLSSLYPTVHGVTAPDKGISPGIDTVAQRMRKAGYLVAAFQANPLCAPQVGYARGFCRYVHFPIRLPSALDANRYTRGDEVNRSALDWLQSNRDRRFFLYIHYMDVHDPYLPTEASRRFGEDAIDLYDGVVLDTDRQFGELFAQLEKLGLLNSTLVILTSDHGEQFLEHGYTKHGHGLYTEETRVPLVIWHPKAVAGQRVSGYCGGIDIAPTILEAAGVPSPPSFQGRSLLAADAGLAGRDMYSELYTIYPTGQYMAAVTSGSSRFILSNPGTSSSLRQELYDLKSDPRESVNLALSQPALAREMRAKAEAFLETARQLHSKAVPEEFVVPLSEEKRRELEALGYLNK